MSDLAIKVENVSKLYRLGEIGTGTVSHDLKRWVARVRGKEDPFAKVGEANNRTQKGESDYVWALKDVNFELQKGEVLGILGRNGAGKSTLLKLLSKVTSPTNGQISVKGRIASLLEVGTGFHPELTGRENIFLNGAILGMTKVEVRRKFDEIVDFSGVERYIDTPVKRYSSGMYVRLAFAVAAFLEPEILVVDEVLAVGDAEFQKKCLGRMKDVSINDGRTVLFVSHNMLAIENLCTSAILMEQGTVTASGKPRELINKYIAIEQHAMHYVASQDEIDANSSIQLLEAGVVSTNPEGIFLGDKFVVKFRYRKVTPDDVALNFILRSAIDEVLFENPSQFVSGVGEFETTFELTPNFLNSGSYNVQVNFVSKRIQVLYYKNPVLSFEVKEGLYMQNVFSKTVGYFFPNYSSTHLQVI